MIKFNNSLHRQQILKAVGSTFEGNTCISREENGRLLGGLVYYNYTYKSIHAHVAGFTNHWVNKEILWMAFHYPFVQCGCEWFLGQLSSANLHAMEFHEKLGFHQMFRLPKGYPDGDLVLIGMHKSECKWLSLHPRGWVFGNGTIQRRSAPGTGLHSDHEDAGSDLAGGVSSIEGTV